MLSKKRNHPCSTGISCCNKQFLSSNNKLNPYELTSNFLNDIRRSNNAMHLSHVEASEEPPTCSLVRMLSLVSKLKYLATNSAYQTENDASSSLFFLFPIWATKKWSEIARQKINPRNSKKEREEASFLSEVVTYHHILRDIACFEVLISQLHQIICE